MIGSEEPNFQRWVVDPEDRLLIHLAGSGKYQVDISVKNTQPKRTLSGLRETAFWTVPHAGVLPGLKRRTCILWNVWVAKIHY